jgi:hypothetical protein
MQHLSQAEQIKYIIYMKNFARTPPRKFYIINVVWSYNYPHGLLFMVYVGSKIERT